MAAERIISSTPSLRRDQNKTKQTPPKEADLSREEPGRFLREKTGENKESPSLCVTSTLQLNSIFKNVTLISWHLLHATCYPKLS